jgi:hypothetical protein
MLNEYKHNFNIIMGIMHYIRVLGMDYTNVPQQFINFLWGFEMAYGNYVHDEIVKIIGEEEKTGIDYAFNVIIRRSTEQYIKEEADAVIAYLSDPVLTKTMNERALRNRLRDEEGVEFNWGELIRSIIRKMSHLKRDELSMGSEYTYPLPGEVPDLEEVAKVITIEKPEAPPSKFPSLNIPPL